MTKPAAEVWMWGDPSAPQFADNRYDVAKSALFQDPPQPQPGEDVEFRLVELHVVSTENEADSDGLGATDYPCRVFTHTGNLLEMRDEMCGTKECHYATSTREALRIYAKIYSTFSKFHKTKKFLSRWIGSPVYRKQAMERGLTDGPAISDEVTRLVEYLWREAMGELREILSVPYRKIGVLKVEKAEGVLLQIRKIIDAGVTDQSPLDKLSEEFYALIPHKQHHAICLHTKRALASKQELCQLIHDIVTVSEATDWSQRSSSQSRYRALQCYLDCLAPDHPEFVKVESLVKSTVASDGPLEIKRIFAASRGVEEAVYAHEIGNDRLLFHSSRPANFLGILSRGLLLPKIVVEVFGGSRRDAGMLGSGIYFGDRVSTAQQYSSPSLQTGTRLMVVNKVALGNIKDLNQFDLTLDEAPEGYHSTHGVSRTDTRESEFKDDEFVVYEANQQCIRYLVEFVLPGDEVIDMPLCETPQVDEGMEELIFCEQAQVESSTLPSDIDLSDIDCAKDPVSSIEAGLVNANETSETVTLQGVHIRARILDLVAQVVVLQAYRNNSRESMEAKYVFPMDEAAAVCSFEAFINDKHVVGVVKEKERAHQEFRKAVEEGHGAYLMDEEAPNVFSVSIGNLPAHSDVLIKVTYVTELAVEDGRLAFNLLGSVAPWKRQEVMAKGGPKGEDTVDVDLETIYKEESVQVAVTVASEITSIESPTHSILVKRDRSEASIQLGKDTKLEDGFQLLIGLKEMHKPRMWLEEHPGMEEQAAMVVFHPDFDVGSLKNPDMVLVLDSSNSMKGELLEEAKKLLLLILRNLPARCTFNVIFFGTEFDELFPESQPKTSANLKAAREFIKGATAEQGCTDFWRPLQSNHLLKSKSTLRNLFLITDGHLSNEEATLRAVGRHRATSRVFTFGVSKTANRHLLAAIARRGGGAFEFFDTKAKSTWEKKIKLQVARASQPAVTSLSVTWDQADAEQPLPPPLQAPAEVTSLFRHDRLLVYGLVHKCQKATLTAEINGKKVEMELLASEHLKMAGKIIHQLAARAVIRNWEEDALHANRTEHESLKDKLKARIVELSIRYSIVTSLTSFIAVEERDEDEQKQLLEGKSPHITQTLQKLLEAEDVDLLTSIHWEDQSLATKEFSPLTRVQTLLQTAKVAVDSYSFKSAEKYFEEAYELAKDTLTYAQPITLKVAHSFSKFCARVKRNMDQAFQLVHGAFQETKKAMPDLEEPEATTVDEDTTKLDDLDALQQAVEWAETCQMEMARTESQSSQPVGPAGYKSGVVSHEEESEGETEWFMSVEDRWQPGDSELDASMAADAILVTYDEVPEDLLLYRSTAVAEPLELLVEDTPRQLVIAETILCSSDSVAMPEPEYLELLQDVREPALLEEEAVAQPARMAKMIEREVLIPEDVIEKRVYIPEPVFASDMVAMPMPERHELLEDVREHVFEEKDAIAEPVKMAEKEVLLPEPVPQFQRHYEPAEVLERPRRAVMMAEPQKASAATTLEDRLEFYDPTIEDEYREMSDEDASFTPRYREETKRYGAGPLTIAAGLFKGLFKGKKKKKSKETDRVRGDSPGIPPLPPPPIHLGDVSAPVPPLPPGGVPTPPQPTLVFDADVDDDLATDTLGSPVLGPSETVTGEVSRLVRLQCEDGYWDLEPELDEILGINSLDYRERLRDRLKAILSQHGATTDIGNSFDAIVRLVVTLMVRLHLQRMSAQVSLPEPIGAQVSKALRLAKRFIERLVWSVGDWLGVHIDWDDLSRELRSGSIK